MATFEAQREFYDVPARAGSVPKATLRVRQTFVSGVSAVSVISGRVAGQGAVSRGERQS